MPIISFHPYQPDSRAAKIVSSKIKAREEAPNAELLLICASPDIEAQIVALSGSRAKKRSLTEKAAAKYTAGFFFPNGVPQDIRTLVETLTEHLTLNSRAGVNVAMALDWHKREDEPGSLVNTEAGRWVQYTKYAPFPNGSGSRRAWREMVDAMAEFVRNHPVYASANVITAPPGHLADGDSWGERLARAVAASLSKPYVAMQSAGPRPELKAEETGQIDLTGQFSVPQALDGRVLIIDDVYRSGATMDAAAKACRGAGASEVLALTVTRTMRR